ncbi:MAG: pyridoxamine kinase [Oscillibacter sp.]|nr:pyridoxamine kinase [Oscillibacter sp.]
MPVPRVAAIHDLSCFGRCSLTIVIPTLSAMGVQCCPLPTACLSTHTGGFQNNTFLDLTAQLEPIASHWKAEGVIFDAVYTGFMSSQEQMALTADFIRNFKHPNCQIIIDPVMGDHGTPYRTYTPAMCRAMAELASLADVITPNRTEAALLLSENYENIHLDTESDCRRWCEALSAGGRRSVVLKGVSLTPEALGAVCFDHKTGQTDFVSASRIPGQFHGTGDLFASVLTGALVKNLSLPEAAQLAASFTSDCARYQGTPCREGLDFEPLLWRLGKSIEEERHA